MNDSLSARLVISKTEAVKGFEFDTVIIGDLSRDSYPVLVCPSAKDRARRKWSTAQ